MKITELKDRVSKYFLSKPEVRVAYVFGSIAKGNEGKLSDIDIAILLDKGEMQKDGSYTYKAKIITDLVSILKTKKVDLVILNESPLFLCFRVVHEGLILYSSDEARRVQFEAKVMSMYFDQEYYYKRHARSTINRIASEGL